MLPKFLLITYNKNQIKQINTVLIKILETTFSLEKIAKRKITRIELAKLCWIIQ